MGNSLAEKIEKVDSKLVIPSDNPTNITRISKLHDYGTELRWICYEVARKVANKKDLERTLQVLSRWKNVLSTITSSKYSKDAGFANLYRAIDIQRNLNPNQTVHETIALKTRAKSPIETLLEKIAEIYAAANNGKRGRQIRVAETSLDNDLRSLSVVINLDMQGNLEWAMKNSSYCISRKDGWFYNCGCYIKNINQDTDYFKVFSSLYDLAPRGGLVPYKNLESSIKNRIPKAKGMVRSDLIKFIQRNLTDSNNGFLSYAKVTNEIPGGKPLVRVVRGRGIEFNNKID